MFEWHGYSTGCPGCRALRFKLSNAQPHNDACRKRIEAEIAKDEEGAEKHKQSQERMRRQQKERDSAERQEDGKR